MSHSSLWDISYSPSRSRSRSRSHSPSPSPSPSHPAASPSRSRSPSRSPSQSRPRKRKRLHQKKKRTRRSPSPSPLPPPPSRPPILPTNPATGHTYWPRSQEFTNAAIESNDADLADAGDADNIAVWVPKVSDDWAWQYNPDDEPGVDPDYCFGCEYSQSIVERQKNPHLIAMNNIWSENGNIHGRARCVLVRDHYNENIRPFAGSNGETGKPWALISIYRHYTNHRCFDSATQLEEDLRVFNNILAVYRTHRIFKVNKNDPTQENVDDKAVGMYIKVYGQRRALLTKVAEGRVNALI